ncbi:MAG: translation initiation factor IF-3 [Nitrospirae bacterium]|nr:MAG: translation initiation factor IF-3 [Nitrospirota bacterium]
MGQEYRVNDRIRAKEVRLVDEDGKQVGIVPLREALRLAEDRGLDLVEVAPNANPPVCKIMDYGKFKYEKKKKQSHKKPLEIKEVKVRPNIDPHDLERKMRDIERFLKEGHKVRVNLFFRGREIVHPEMGLKVLNKIEERFKEEFQIEGKPGLEGKRMSMVIAPGKKTKK